jgi:hypothetical protein
VRVVAGRPEANIHACHAGLDVCAGVAVAAALAALTVRDRDAAATMIRHRRPSPADAAVLPGEGATAASTD